MNGSSSRTDLKPWITVIDIKRLLQKVRIYAFAQKNTDMRIKFLLSLVCFILPFTEHAYIRMRFFYA